MRVNIRGSRSGHPGSLVVRGNQSRRDLTKVAQHEVLGQRSQGAIRPGRGRDDRPIMAIAEPRARPNAVAFLSSLTLTGRTCLLLHFPALRTGLLSLSPSGTKVLTGQSSS
jgi:hypothetical protein